MGSQAEGVSAEAQLRAQKAAYDEFYEHDPIENQLTWEPVFAAAVGRLLEPIPDPPESRLQMVRIKHEAKVAYRAWLIGGEQ